MTKKQGHWLFLIQIIFATVFIFMTIACEEDNIKGMRPVNNNQGGQARSWNRSSNSKPMEFVYPCPDHIFPFCTDENPFGISYKSATKGYAAFPKTANIGCLVTAPGPAWYYMQIDHPGDLLIYIEQTSMFFKLDVDFACWGPFEAKSKKEFLDRLCASYYKLNVDSHPNHRPKDGNHHGDTGGYPFDNLVDCSFDPAGTEWCYIPNAKTGEWYLLLLTNYSRQPGTIHFERVDEMSTATTNCDIVTPIKLNPVPKGLRKIDDHTTAICLYEDKALVTIELETEDGYTLPRGSLQKCAVTIYANNKKYQATLEKDHFECEIDILNDTTAYFANIICPDPKFELDTETYSIVRTTDCDPDLVKFTKGAPHHAGDLTTIELLRGDKPINLDFSDPYGIQRSLPESQGLRSPDDYDITVDFDHMFIERVSISKDGDVLKLTPHLKGEWCDCFVPDTMTFQLRMIPNGGNIHDRPYEIPIQIGINHPTAWASRCLWVLVLIGSLLLLILYLWLLMRKNRFKKNAIITATYYDYYGNKREGESPNLRKEGFGAWFVRWFLPGDERNTLSFDKPATTLRFVAAESNDVVNIPKEGNIDSEVIRISGYNPQKDPRPKDPVKLGDRGRINVLNTDGSEDGYLIFTSGDAIDGTFFRMVLGILILVAVLIIITLIVLIIRGVL